MITRTALTAVADLLDASGVEPAWVTVDATRPTPVTIVTRDELDVERLVHALSDAQRYSRHGWLGRAGTVLVDVSPARWGDHTRDERQESIDTRAESIKEDREPVWHREEWE